MRCSSFLAAGLSAVAFATLPVFGGRVPASRAAPASLEQRRSKAPARRVTVREVDLEGLKKLLQRGAKQTRPLLVNFWATYCEPCRDEFPDLVQIDKDYKRHGLDFLTISLDDPTEIKTTVPQFLQEMRAAMPAYLLNVSDPEPAIKWVDQAWSGGLPATYLYDPQGQVLFKHTGRIKPAALRAVLDKTFSIAR